MDSVILVNELDEEVGRAEKLAAHQHNLLHRAFSVFIFNHKATNPLLKLLFISGAMLWIV